MADADKPIHRGNQAFIDEDYPATLQVSLVSSFSRRRSFLRCFAYCCTRGRGCVATRQACGVRQAWEDVPLFVLTLTSATPMLESNKADEDFGHQARSSF